MPTIHVMRDSPPKLGRCSGCDRQIEWVRTLKTGAAMPVDVPLEELEHVTRLDGTESVRIDSGQSHFVTCPYASTFRRRR